MVSRELLVYLRLVHGSYNTLVMLLFTYQGWLGLTIRRSRLSGARSLDAVKRHRKIGPMLVFLCMLGFITGITIVYLDTHRVIQYQRHFFTGLGIVTLLGTTFTVSRKIKGAEIYWRNIHFVLGILIICLYGFQAFLGLGVLL